MKKILFASVLTFALLGIVSFVAETPAPIEAEGKEYDFVADYKKTLTKLAKQHNDVGKRWRKSGFETRAKDHFIRAIVIDPDHAQARRYLGFKKKDGNWVQDSRPLSSDTVKEEDADEEAAKAEEKIAKINTRSAKYVRELMTRASKRGTKENAATAAHLISFYAPNDPEASAMRGFEEYDEKWLRPGLISGLKKGKKDLEAGIEGDEAPLAEDYVSFLQVEWHRRATPRLIVRSALAEVAARRSMKVGNATLDYCGDELGLGRKEPLGKSAYYFTRVRLKTNWDAFIDKQNTTDEQKAFRKGLSGTGTSKPRGFFTRAFPQSSSDDMLSNTLALNVLRQARKGVGSPPMFYLGYTYYVTGRILGTTATKRYTLETKKKGTSVRGKNLKPTFGGPRYGPEFFRNLVKWNVATNQDPSLRFMSQMGLNEFKERHAAKCFALMEFLMETQREKTLKWLTTPFKDGKEDLANLAKALGHSTKELDEALSTWIWANY